MTDSSCKIQMAPGSTEAALTVGQPFELSCDGDWTKFDFRQAEFKLDEADLYKIKILSGTVGSNEAHLKVASYVVGDHSLKALSLVSGNEARNLNGVHFQVTSVLDPKEPPAEPFGPRGPFGLSFPWWYHAIWITFVLVILSLIFKRWKNWREKRKLIAALEAQGAAVEPFAQFNQSLRRLQRQFSFLGEKQEALIKIKIEFAEELEKAYRTYIGRTFLIPTFTWKDSHVLRELKSTDKKVFQEQGAAVDRLLQEFQKAKEQKEQLKNQDLLQLLEFARKNVDEIFLLRRKDDNSEAQGWKR